MRHKRRVHGTTPELTKCEKCGIKRIALFSHKCKGCQDKTERTVPGAKSKHAELVDSRPRASGPMCF